MYKLILNMSCDKFYVNTAIVCCWGHSCSGGYMEIITKYVLCQTLCKFCNRVLLRANLVAVVMWKFILNIYCARLYVNSATVCGWGICWSGGYVEIKTKHSLCQIVGNNCYRELFAGTVVGVVMWKLIPKNICARFYIKCATVNFWRNCCSGGYVEIKTQKLMCQILCK